MKRRKPEVTPELEAPILMPPEAVAVAPSPSVEPGAPVRVEVNWLEAWKSYQEAVLFVKTARQLVTRPRAFCDEWVQGRREAMNPAVFWLVALALDGLATSIGREIAGKTEAAGATFLSRVGMSAQTYLGTLAFATVLHLILRHPTRPLGSYRSTLAATLYGFGAFSVLTWPLTVLTPSIARVEFSTHWAIGGTGGIDGWALHVGSHTGLRSTGARFVD